MPGPEPRRPTNLEPLAVELLERIRREAFARHLVIGGGVALQHYVDYRGTHDVDVRWTRDATIEERDHALRGLRSIAEAIGAAHALDVRERRRTSSEVVSIEFLRDGVQVFSFQIAARDVELEHPDRERSPWTPIAIETFDENVASKMSALVSRGAPRDFRDVHAVVAAGMIETPRLWDLWARKHPGDDRDAARGQVAHHLEQLELRRPIDVVPLEDRERARALRTWVRCELLAPDVDS